jgi:PAS domain S-box-containing protein
MHYGPQQIISATRREQEFEQELETLRFQRDLAVSLNTATTLTEAARHILQALLHLNGIDAGGLYLVEQQTGDLTLIEAVGVSPEFVQAHRCYKGDTAIARATLEGNSLYTPPLILPDTRGWRMVEGLRASALFPIAHHNKIIAALVLATHTQEEIGAWVQPTIEGVGGLIGSVLARVERHIASEESYRELVENISDLLYTLDEQGKFIYANPVITQLTGYSSSEIIGRSFTDLVYSEDIPFVVRAYHQRKMGELASLEYRIVTRDGSIRWVRSSSRPLLQNGQTIGLQGIASDITERVRYEHSREVVIKVAAALRKASNHADMIPILLDQVITLLHMEEAALLIYGPEPQAWRMEKSLRTIEYLTPQRRSPLGLIRSPAAHCVPLIAQDKTIGTLCIGCHQKTKDEDIFMLKAIGDMAASAIHRITLHEQTRRHLQQVQALHTLDQVITSHFDLHKILTTLLEQVSAVLKVDAADVLLFNRRMQELEYAVGYGFASENTLRLRMPPEACCFSQVLSERHLTSIPDIRQCTTSCGRKTLLEAEGIVTYHCMPLIASGELKGVLELFCRGPLTPGQEWVDFLTTLAGQAAIAIEHAELFSRLRSTNDELTLSYDTTIAGWARALEMRDAETQGHSQRVTDLTLRLARKMGFDDEELVHIRRGAQLHDIGKMAIPDTILLKSETLTPAERKMMQQHPTYAYQWLSHIPFLRPALDIPYCHHEKWDGSGYPRGLKGQQIPLTARIFAVVDVWDALLSNRPYRPGWSYDEVREHIHKQSGRHFDPAVVEVFLQMVEEEQAVARAAAEEQSKLNRPSSIPHLRPEPAR